MSRATFHRLISVLCLIAFGCQVGAIGWLVRCTAPSGTSHLEWGACATDGQGGCAEQCDSQSHDEASNPKPCDDRPLQSDGGIARVRTTSHSIVAELPAVDCVVPSFPVEPGIVANATPHVEWQSCSSPAIASIRTVILVI